MKRKFLSRGVLSGVISLVLLLVFQTLWLLNSYEKAFDDLRREANSTFRSTSFALRDSIINASLVPIGVNDSLGLTDSVQQWLQKPTRGRIRLLDRRQSVEIFVSSRQDSVQVSPNVVFQAGTVLAKDSTGPRSFVYRLQAEELPQEKLLAEFTKHLNLPVKVTLKADQSRDRLREGRLILRPPFSERERLREPEQRVFSDSLYGEPLRLSPISHYQPILSDIRWYLLGQITPQILFSVFLTFITALSFLQLWRTLRKQDKLMALRNDFIHNVTHELKTPVATASVALEALRTFSALEDRTRTTEYLGIASREVTKLGSIAEKILQVTQQETKPTAEFETTNLKEVVESAVESIALIANARQAIIKMQLSDELYIKGNREELTEMLINLLENALKYSKETPVVNITLQRVKNKVQIKISDQGIGIAQEYHDRIFEKFFRVPLGNLHPVKGYGLGLSLVKSIVENHHGHIQVDSSVGEGASFTITFPSTDD